MRLVFVSNAQDDLNLTLTSTWWTESSGCQGIWQTCYVTLVESPQQMTVTTCNQQLIQVPRFGLEYLHRLWRRSSLQRLPPRLRRQWILQQSRKQKAQPTPHAAMPPCSWGNIASCGYWSSYGRSVSHNSYVHENAAPLSETQLRKAERKARFAGKTGISLLQPILKGRGRLKYHDKCWIGFCVEIANKREQAA